MAAADPAAEKLPRRGGDGAQASASASASTSTSASASAGKQATRPAANNSDAEAPRAANDSDSQRDQLADAQAPPCSPTCAKTLSVMDDDAGEPRGRRSSAGSCSDASDAAGDASAAAVHQLPLPAGSPRSEDAAKTDASSPVKRPSGVPKLAVDVRARGAPASASPLRSPRTFEQVVSPRSLANGKRFLSGYLQRRVPVAAGLLRSWRRQFFRLRDHGVVCYKDAASGSAAPLFELCFTAHSVVQAERSRGDQAAVKARASAAAADDPYAYIPEDEAAARVTVGRKQSAGSLTFLLKHVEVVAGQLQAKVDLPVFLRAENEHEFGDWLYCLRLKMDARKQALTAEAATRAASGSSSEPPAAADDAGDAPRATSKGMSGEEADQLTDMKSPASAKAPAGGGSMPKGSLLLSLKRSLSFGRRSTLLFGVSSEDPPEFAQFHQRYMLLREIGEGSFSIVHKAVNRLTGRMCAVKCCKYSSTLVEEVRIMRTLTHPNLVKVEGVFKHDDMHYVVMDYMGDGDLCDMLLKKQRLPEKDARRVIAQVLQGLEHLHANCVLHRDIKPENILLHGDMVKIADFGLAKQLANPDATVNRSCGTVEYAAPELLCGRDYGLKSDIFSLGVVMYVLLFGAFPFSIESAAALQALDKFPRGVDIRDMSCLSPDNFQWRIVSPEAQDAILRMLTHDAADRISAAELLHHPWFDVLTAREAPALSRRNSSLLRNSSTASLGGIRAMLDQQASSRAYSQYGNAPTDRQGAADEQQPPLTRWQRRELTSAGHEMSRELDCERLGFRELLCRGLEVTKFGFKSSTSPHVSVLRLDLANRCISWTGRPSVVGNLGGSSRSALSTSTVSSSTAQPSGKKRPVQKSMLLAEVLEIRLGHETDAFQRALQKAKPVAMPPAAVLCLSIVSAHRTLDMAFKTPSQRAFVERGVRELLAAIQPQGGAASTLVA